MGLRELSPELAKVAKDELGEDPGRTQADLQAIKDWLAKQRHINARTGALFFILFFLTAIAISSVMARSFYR